jgi:hypothetical protein
MITLPGKQVVESAPDQLGWIVLGDLLATRTWSEWNYINEANKDVYRGEAAAAIAGALAWLRGQGFVGRDPDNPSDSAIIVTPAGRRAFAERSSRA